MQLRQNSSSQDIERDALLSEDSPSIPGGNTADGVQTGGGETPLHSSSIEQNSNRDGALRGEDPECQTSILLSGSGSYREYVVYSERWYILAVFSFTAAMQSWGWNTWGPIEDSATAVFGWNPGDFALLVNWGGITYILSAFFFSWLLHAKGLRLSMLITLGLLVLGMGVRCLPVPSHAMLWTSHIGQILIGLAAPIVIGGVTTISAVWFSTNERTTATAIGTCTVFFGAAVSFILGPQIVEEIYPLHTNESTVSPVVNGTDELYAGYPEGDYDPEEVQKCLREIKILLLIQFAWTGLLAIAAVVYFPDTPITPPTASAVVKREDVKAGLLMLVKKKDFWIPTLAYSMSTGCFSSWSTQIVSIFNNHVDQNTSGWIGFYSNVAACIGGIVFGRYVDYLGGKMKEVLLGLIFGMCLSFVWALLLSNGYISFNTVSLYCSVILFTFFVNAAAPLFFEVTVEGSFPVGEETTTMFVTWLSNVPAVLFLVLPMFPSVSSNFGDWLNWMMLGAVVVCIPLMLFYKEQYNRLQFDRAHPDEEINEEEAHAGPPASVPSATVQS